MAITKKDDYKAAKRSTMLVAVAIHVIVGLILYFTTPIGKMAQDFVVEMVQGKTVAPPPPPKAKIKQIDVKRPPTLKPEFKVNTQVKIDPKFAPVFTAMSSFNMETPVANFSNMAQTYTMKTFNLGQAQVANVTSDLLSAIGIGDDLMGGGRGTKVSGVGKRMRARLNVCLASTPGSTVLGALGRKSESSAGNSAKATEDTLKTKVTWDYVFRKYNSVERARAWLKENTQIQVTDNTTTLNLENTFSEWVANVRKRGALALDSASVYYELLALKRLEHAIELIDRNKISGSRDFVKTVHEAVYRYLADKYELKEMEAAAPDAIVKKIEERNIMREWRKRGLLDVLTASNALKTDGSEDRLINAIKPVYLFLRNAQALENPLLILCNLVGLEKIPEENLEILRNYVRNGGFIWIDETGIATANARGQDIAARGFIHRLMAFDESETLSDKETETFQNLSRSDRDVQGYILGPPFPLFAHPQAWFPVTLPINAPVTVRVFNRLGIAVKQFVWSKDKPMKAGSYIKKEAALVWNCDNNSGEPVESGNYFVQMESGLYQKTHLLHVSKLRKLDEKHPLMGVVHTFRNVPICTIESGSRFWETRPYGNAAFGYYLHGRMCILYTEGAGVVAGLGDQVNVVAKDQACKFMNNIIAFCLSDEDGVAIRP
ncbi:MAG: hypothetical protein V1913_06750 [Fibrobacterota bacterium]